MVVLKGCVTLQGYSQENKECYKCSSGSVMKGGEKDLW